MTKSRKRYNFDEVIKEASKYINDQKDLDKLEDGFNFALLKHEGQFRKSGEEYIEHPVATALILTTIYADRDTIIAGLLHDTIEDCDVTYEEIEDKFGKTVANLVYGVTKINKIKFSTANENLIEYYKKIIVGMSEDVRVIIIKLADRLHNMRTLWALSPEKQKEKAKETIEILAPIANHLGINKIKSELEDLSLKYLKPNVFYDIAEELNNTKLARDNAVMVMIKDISELLLSHNIKHTLKGRSKSIYSIYKKMEKGKKFSDIYDLLGIRIFVSTEQDCYTTLGIIHSKFRPLPGRFKDYIAMPKANGYQSLHTTVFGKEGVYFEIQIRTYDMDEVAENGVASHWAYKENKNLKENNQTLVEQKLQFFKSIMELREDDMSSEEFVNSVKNEILNDNIYVYTPKGDIFEMPKGSTPVDFAYRIHTRVGETTVGATVNNTIVPLDFKLNNNDIVKIITDKSSPGPSYEWLKFVRATQTKNKIKSFFAKSEKESLIERGSDLLERYLKKNKKPISILKEEDYKNKLFKEYKVTTWEELYVNIGKGKIELENIYYSLYPEEKAKQEIKEIKLKNLIKEESSPVTVEGINEIKVNIAMCCSPLPGDDIIGFITKNNGISVHQKKCHNIIGLDERFVHVKWHNNSSQLFMTKLIIALEKNDSNSKMINILELANKSNINVESFRLVNQEKEDRYELVAWVKDLEYLDKFKEDIKKKEFVKSIERVME